MSIIEYGKKKRRVLYGEKVLLTGFDPFGGETVNPSWEAVKRLNGAADGPASIVSEQVPTVFISLLPSSREAIKKHQPDIIICVGQAGGRMQITPERVAINLNEARIPDNERNQPVGENISQDGPAAYWTGLPIKRIVEEIKRKAFPRLYPTRRGRLYAITSFTG